MSERMRSTSDAGYPSYVTGHNSTKMASDLTPKKTMLILVIVVGCFAVLWPKVFYPMLLGSAQQQMKPSDIDKRTGCCDVISDTDVDTIKILSELCKSIIEKQNEVKQLTGKEIVSKCRSEVLKTCGIDISAVLQEQIKLGRNVKQILDDVRSLNGSLCLKYNYGLPPSRLGVGHRVTTLTSTPAPSIKQERPHVKSDMLHPAFREKGRAIPQLHTSSPSRPPPRIVEGRPGPVPGMRPTIGGAGHVVPPSKQGTSSMSVIMPLYTIGIVVFFSYTLMKVLFKKQPDGVGGSLYPPVEPDPHFRREVFESEKSQLASRLARDGVTSKLVVNAMSALLDEVDQELEARRRVKDAAAQDEHIANGVISNGSAVRPQDHGQPSVTVMEVELTASHEGGQKWTGSDSPILPHPHNTAPPEPTTPPQEIFLEGTLPPESQLLVADAAAEAQKHSEEDPAVVLAGKVTLAVVNLDGEEENVQESQDIVLDDKMIGEQETERTSLDPEREVSIEPTLGENKIEIDEFEKQETFEPEREVSIEPALGENKIEIDVFEKQEIETDSKVVEEQEQISTEPEKDILTEPTLEEKKTEINEEIIEENNPEIDEFKIPPIQTHERKSLYVEEQVEEPLKKETEEATNVSFNGQPIENKDQEINGLNGAFETPKTSDLHMGDLRNENESEKKLIQDSAEKVQKDFNIQDRETETEDFLEEAIQAEMNQRKEDSKDELREKTPVVESSEIEDVPKVELEKEIDSLIEEAKDIVMAKPPILSTDSSEEFERLKKVKEKDIEKLLHEVNDPLELKTESEILTDDILKEIASSVEIRNGTSKLEESLESADIDQGVEEQKVVSRSIEKVDQPVEELLEENDIVESEANTLQEVSNIEDESAPVENRAVIEQIFQDKLNNLEHDVDPEEQKTDEEILDSEEEIEYEEEDVEADIEEGDQEDKIEPVTSTQDEKMNDNEVDESKNTNVSSAAIAERNLSERDKTEDEVVEDDDDEEEEIEEVIYVDDDEEVEEEEEDEEEEEEVEIEEGDEIDDVHPADDKTKINHIPTDRNGDDE